MGWGLVTIASVFEILGVIALKIYSQSKNLLYAVLFSTGFLLSFAFLYHAFKYLNVSIAYAVWIGIGTAGAVLVNMIFFGESRDWRRVVCLAIILFGVIGLKLVS